MKDADFISRQCHEGSINNWNLIHPYKQLRWFHCCEVKSVLPKIEAEPSRKQFTTSSGHLNVIDLTWRYMECKQNLQSNASWQLPATVCIHFAACLATNMSRRPPEKLGVHSLTAQARLVMTCGILGFQWVPFCVLLCDVWQVSFQDLPITFGRNYRKVAQKGAKIPVKFGNAKSEMDQWGLTWNACNSCHRIGHSNTGAVICRFFPQAC